VRLTRQSFPHKLRQGLCWGSCVPDVEEREPAPARRARPVAAAIYGGLLIAIAAFGFGRAWEPLVAAFDDFFQSIAVFEATRSAFQASLHDNADTPRALSFFPHTITVYPILAIRHGEQGDVILRVLVLRNGEVGDAQILRSSGHPQLDAAALIGVGYWFYLPAVRDHRPVESWVTVLIRFRIPGADGGGTS
jgi:TonB family protein